MVFERALVVLVLIGMAPVAVCGETTKDKIVVIHVTSVPGDDASRFYSMTRLAVAAVEEGRTVVMLFDGKGALSVRLGSWYGGDTSLLDRLDIPEAERKSLSGSLRLSVASTPSNYGDLLRLLRGKGVELYVNSDMMRLHGISDEAYDTAFIKAEPEKVLKILERADVYVSY